MSTKILERADIKATVVDTRHSVEFYALAFGNVDKQGDRIAPEAVDEWLDTFYRAKRPLVISFTHAAVREPHQVKNIVGTAPADPEHVWKDSHGLRIRAYLNTEDNDIARYLYGLLKEGAIWGASVAYYVPDGGEERLGDGSTLIKRMEILEAGPVLDPANTEAFIVEVKALLETMVETKAVDGSAWDGGRAMGQCSTAAEYGRIAFRRTGDSDPDTAAAWALPHHYLGQAPNPNAKGVAAAIGALNGARGGAPSLRDAGAARSHLEAHQREITSAREAAYPTSSEDTSVEGEVRIAADGEALLKSFAVALRNALSEVIDDTGVHPPDEEASTEEPTVEEESEAADLGPNADLRQELAEFGE